MEASQHIVRGSVLVVLAQMFVRVFSLVFEIFVARRLTATFFGEYSFILSYTAMFFIVSDFGINTYLIYTLARDSRDLDAYVNSAMSVKIVLVVLMVGMNYGLALILGRTSSVVAGICIISASLAVNAIQYFFRAMLQARGEMGYEALLSSLETLVRVLVGTAFLICGSSFLVFVSSYLLSAVFLLIVTLRLASKKLGLRKLQFDLSHWKPIVRETLPFGAALVFISIYGQVDVVILGLMSSSAMVAWYSVGLRLATFWVFVVSALVTAIFPSLCRLYEVSQPRLVSLCRKAFKLTFAVGLFISLELMIMSRELVQFVYGSKYEQSVPVLVILSWTGLLLALNMLLGAFVRAIKQQRINGIVSGVALVASVGMNLLLIPGLGYQGTAIACLCTQILVSVLYTVTIWKRIGAFWSIADLLNPLVVGAIVALVNLLLRQQNMALVFATCAGLYLALLYVTKFITKQDLHLLGESLYPR
jgi:O-antigen/teichoic acid export membrane protein